MLREAVHLLKAWVARIDWVRVHRWRAHALQAGSLVGGLFDVGLRLGFGGLLAAGEGVRQRVLGLGMGRGGQVAFSFGFFLLGFLEFVAHEDEGREE